MKKPFPLDRFIIPFLAVAVTIFFLFFRFYHIDQTLIFFGDMGRDFWTLREFYQTKKPPLLGPQTSVTSFNQSAIYFYFLFPFYLITGQSPYATIVAVSTLYLGLFYLALWHFKKDKDLQLKTITLFFLISINPQFINQHRYPWNPSFITPFLLVGFWGIHKLNQKFNTKFLWITALSLATAVSLTYSVIPTVLIMFLYLLIRNKNKILQITGAFLASGLITNLPTFVYELRHNFHLTRALHTQEVMQTASLNMAKVNMLFSNLFMTNSNSYLIILLTLITIVLVFKQKEKKLILPASLFFFISLILHIVLPLIPHHHYLFGILTFWLLSLSLTPKKYLIIVVALASWWWLQPQTVMNYFKPAEIPLKQKVSCAQKLCSKYQEPIFLTLHSASHNHQALGYRFLFQTNGCNTKDVFYDKGQSDTLIVISQQAEYTHRQTDFFEISQFGKDDSKEIDIIDCEKNLRLHILRK